ncbi:hypothetical protein B0H19DRAFT_951909, partial [Mycena capillaripes]
WVTIYFSLPANTRFPGKVKMLHLCSVIQSCILFAFAFAMLGTATTFGPTPECNHNAVVVLFRPFAALDVGRILFLVLTALVVIIYGGIIYKDWKDSFKRLGGRMNRRLTKKKRPNEEIDINNYAEALPAAEPAPCNAPEPENTANRAPDTQIYGYTYRYNVDEKVVLNIIVVLILWALAVMNTELLIRWNHFAVSDDSQSQWQFGQILPMFLVVLPLISLVNAFMESGFRQSEGLTSHNHLRRVIHPSLAKSLAATSGRRWLLVTLGGQCMAFHHSSAPGRREPMDANA